MPKALYPADISVSATTIRRLMRRYGVTIAQVAQHFGLPKTRVRHVREHGGPSDWPLMIELCARKRSHIRQAPGGGTA